jgi:uncharacterized protein (TIGR03067 family)
MRVRLAVVLLLLAGPAAFAPAPFPKKVRPRAEPEISLKSLQGTWRIVSIHSTRPDGRHIPEPFSIKSVRVAEDRWTFLPDNYNGARLELAIDHTKTPAQFTFYAVGQKKQTPHGVGLVRKRGGRIEILYAWGGEQLRPRAFEPAPDAYYLMTLERE